MACELARGSILSAGPNRCQNRLTQSPLEAPADQPFRNEPNTDFSLPANRQWATRIIDKWKDIELDPIPIQIGGQFNCAATTGCLGHDGDVSGAVEDHAKPDPHDLVIVDNQHRDRLSVGVMFRVRPLRHPTSVGNLETLRRPSGG